MPLDARDSWDETAEAKGRPTIAEIERRIVRDARAVTPIPPAVAEFAVLELAKDRTVAVDEWQVSTVLVQVDEDGRGWSVVVTAHDGTRVVLPSELIDDLAKALDVLEPPYCQHPAGCGRFADLSRDDERCTEHALSRRF